MKLLPIFLLMIMFSAISYGEDVQKNDSEFSQKSNGDGAQKSSDEAAQKYDEDVKDFIKERIVAICNNLRTYHYIMDKISEKPIDEDYFDDAKLKTFPRGVQEQIRQAKLLVKFLDKNFADVDEVNKTLKSLLTLRSKLIADDEKTEEILTRKRARGKLSWAKCENELKVMHEKSYQKWNRVYLKTIEKYLKKYKI